MPQPLSDLRVAVVGFGSIGRRHFDNLERLGVSRRVVVRRPAGANPAFEAPPGTRVVATDEAALDEGLDLAIIANPTRLHVETALKYVAAGVAVLVEKPLGQQAADAARLVNLARRRGALAGMAYSMRYHPAYALARSAIAAGRIGQVLYAKAWFESHVADWHPWEDYRQSYAARSDLGGGALPTLDHEIDFLNWCLGDPTAAVGWTARTKALDADVDDLAALLVRYPGGVVATAVLSLCRRDRSRGFEFIGSRGTLRHSVDTGRLELVSGSEPVSQLLWDGCEYDLNAMYVDMLSDFLNALTAGVERTVPVPLEAGLATLAVAARAAPCTPDREAWNPPSACDVPL